VAWAMLGMTAARLDAQMMAGGRDVRGGRQAMTERLANVSPEQRAFLETLRAGGEETYSAQSVTLTAETNRLRSGPV